jgi:hypothetical protein
LEIKDVLWMQTHLFYVQDLKVMSSKNYGSKFVSIDRYCSTIAAMESIFPFYCFYFYFWSALTKKARVAVQSSEVF